MDVKYPNRWLGILLVILIILVTLIFMHPKANAATMPASVILGSSIPVAIPYTGTQDVEINIYATVYNDAGAISDATVECITSSTTANGVSLYLAFLKPEAAGNLVFWATHPSWTEAVVQTTKVFSVDSAAGAVLAINDATDMITDIVNDSTAYTNLAVSDYVNDSTAYLNTAVSNYINASTSLLIEALRRDAATAIAPEYTQGDTVTGVIPMTQSQILEAVAAYYVYDATGASAETGTSATSENSINGGYFMEVKVNPVIAGALVIGVSHPDFESLKVLGTTVKPAGTIVESTMHYLTASISRSSTWTVAAPITRSSSAYYESALWETYKNDQGEVNRHHVVIYDQATDISNYFQKGRHYWVGTAAAAIECMTRAVPDGDWTRYHVQE